MNISTSFLDLLSGSKNLTGVKSDKTSGNTTGFPSIIKIFEAENSTTLPSKQGPGCNSIISDLNGLSENELVVSNDLLSKLSESISNFISSLTDQIKLSESSQKYPSVTVNKKQLKLSQENLAIFLNGIASELTMNFASEIGLGINLAGGEKDLLNQASSDVTKSLTDFIKQNNSLNLTFKNDQQKLTIKIVQDTDNPQGQAIDLTQEQYALPNFLAGLTEFPYSNPAPESNPAGTPRETNLSPAVVNKASDTVSQGINQGINKVLADNKEMGQESFSVAQDPGKLSPQETEKNYSADVTHVLLKDALFTSDKATQGLYNFKNAFSQQNQVMPAAGSETINNQLNQAVSKSKDGFSTSKQSFNSSTSSTNGETQIDGNPVSFAALTEPDKQPSVEVSDPTSSGDFPQLIISNLKIVSGFSQKNNQVLETNILSDSAALNQKIQPPASAGTKYSAIADELKIADVTLEKKPIPNGTDIKKNVAAENLNISGGDKIAATPKTNTQSSIEFSFADAKKVIAVADTSGLKSITNDVKPAAKEDDSEPIILSSDDDKSGVLGDLKVGQTKTSDDKEFFKQHQSDGSKNDLLQNTGNSGNIDKTVSSSKLITEAEQTKTIKASELIPDFAKNIQLGEKQSITYQLSPENLGKVKLVVDLAQNQINTRIEVENEQVKQFIQSNIDQLKSSLEQSGVHMNAVSVSLSNYDQGSSKAYSQYRKTSLGKVSKIKVPDEQETQTIRSMGYNTYEYLA